MSGTAHSPGEPTNPRERRRREQRRLFWAVVGFLVVVGSVSIALAYGSRAVLLGLVCLSSGAVVLGLLWLILATMERLAK